MADADQETRRQLRQLAGSPATVRFDQHGTGNMLAWRLKRDDVRSAICDALDAGDRVKQTTVKKHPAALVGQPAWEVTPMIRDKRFYIRMTFHCPEGSGKVLLVVSVHRDV